MAVRLHTQSSTSITPWRVLFYSFYFHTLLTKNQQQSLLCKRTFQLHFHLQNVLLNLSIPRCVCVYLCVRVCVCVVVYLFYV